MKGKVKHSIEKVDFKSKRLIEREEVRYFGDLKQVEKVGKLHKAKRRVKIDQKRENLEGQMLYLAHKAKKEERNAKNHAKRRENRRAKRRK